MARKADKRRSCKTANITSGRIDLHPDGRFSMGKYWDMGDQDMGSGLDESAKSARHIL